jgi:hypothetical protein
VVARGCAVRGIEENRPVRRRDGHGPVRRAWL